MAKTLIEKYKTKERLNINESTVELGIDLIGKVLRIVSLTTDDENILYMQDEKTLVYELLNPKKLRNKVARELAKNGLYPKSEQIKDMVDVIKNYAYIESQEYDEVKNRLMVNNGYFKYEKGKMKFIKVEPKRLEYVVCLKRVYIDYDEDAHLAKNKTIENFFNQIMCNDKSLVDYLFHALATPLVERNKYEKAFIFYGASGANGKTVLSDLMSMVYSKRNISHVELAEMKDWNLSLMDKTMINWVQDLEKYDEWPNFKKIVTGESIIVNVKYSDPVEKEISTQIFINSNILPNLGTKRDGGYLRRLSFIPFNNIFKNNKKDPNILAKLGKTENLEWLFSKLVATAKDLESDFNGIWFDVNEPDAVKQLKQEQAENDSSPLGFSAWVLNESYQVGSEIKIDVGLLYNEEPGQQSSIIPIGMVTQNHGTILQRTIMYNTYKEYCRQANMHPVSKPNFEKMIDSESPYIKLDKNSRTAHYRGFFKIIQKGGETHE